MRKASNVFGDIELICKGHTVPRGYWEDLVLAVAIEGRPFDFGIFRPITEVEYSLPALVGYPKSATYL